MAEEIEVENANSPIAKTPDQAECEIRRKSSSASSSASHSIRRLWRPAAQRNVRNQWSKLSSSAKQWDSFSSSGRSYATALVNAHLSLRYMPSMELGVLSDMPEIRKKASLKLLKQQDLQRHNLLSTYKDLVAVVTQMENTSRSMRCFLKRTGNSPLIQFSTSCEDATDRGDGGGIPVYTFWSMSSFEKLAEELVEMFELELILKRMLVLHLLSISKVPADNTSDWSTELYQGEFDDLTKCNLYSTERCEPLLPKLKNGKSETLHLKNSSQTSHETLQVYLTTWLAELNINTHRVNEIFAIVGEELHCSIS